MSRRMNAREFEAVRRRRRNNSMYENDPAPWRCVACNEAVSNIRNNWCKCIRDIAANAPEV